MYTSYTFPGQSEFKVLLTEKPVGADADQATKLNLHCPRAPSQSAEQCQQHHNHHHHHVDNGGDEQDDDDGNSTDVLRQNIWMINWHLILIH